MAGDPNFKLSGRRRFVLEAIDPVTECPTVDMSFEVDEVGELCSMIEANLTDVDAGAEYQLEPHEVDRLRTRFKIQFSSGSLAVRLRCWSPLDDLPYKVHTGRELALMLDGTKPLAYFSGQHSLNPDCKEIPERLFDPYVAAGRFIKREYVVPAGRPATIGGSRLHDTRVVLYALTGQDWRIEAFVLLQNTAAKTGWSEGFERMQGSLLGYEEWQNDIFIEKIYRPACEVQKR